MCLSYRSSVVEDMFHYNVSLVLQFCRGYVSLQCVSRFGDLRKLFFAKFVPFIAIMYNVSVQCVSRITVL
jgi:hypothetical protein